jgi:hypothetical protein
MLRLEKIETSFDVSSWAELNWSKIGGFGLVVIDRAELNKARQEGGY